jgi:hypothetical protein
MYEIKKLVSGVGDREYMDTYTGNKFIARGEEMHKSHSGFFDDTDVTFVWNEDGTIAQAVQVDSSGRTRTTIFTWSDSKLQSIAPVVT